MFTLIVFLLVISVLVFVHEAGHFIMAKRSGMRVDEFGFGFPPKLWGKKVGETEYTLNAIPFGGFVRIYGEDGAHASTARSFGAGTFFQKVGVIVAGVVMNFLFAAALLIVVNFLGLRVGVFDDHMASRVTDPRVQILQVSPDSPAQAADLRALDEILGFRIDGKLVGTYSPEDVQKIAFGNTGKTLVMVIRRGSTDVDVPILLRATTQEGKGPIGIALATTGVVRYPWYESLWRGFADAGNIFIGTILGYWGLLKSLLGTGHLGADVSGPVGIATLTGQAAHVGINYLLQFVALISVNLAVLNIFPFPALDGGRLVLVIAEKIRGRALSQSVEGAINSIGFMILLALMVAVTVKDIVHFF